MPRPDSPIRAASRNRPRRPAASPRLAPGGKAVPAVVREIFARTRARGFASYLKELLVELCRIDTTPKPDVARMREAEANCFRLLERELKALNFSGARLERREMNPGIKSHPNYSLLHFTKTAQRPEGLSPEEAYKDRSNLVYLLPGANGPAAGQSVALNAHIDVVAPYVAPRVKGGTVFGRGACDDKGPVVSIVAAVRVLTEVLAATRLKLNRNVLAMFVIEEETGGNGSLSLATDYELKRWYDSILVSECTGLKVHPANRGAVWYRAELNAPEGLSPLEMFAFVNEEMEKEGTAIRAESRHPLFPQRPVQTCHGILGPFGEHPSRICGKVVVSIEFERKPDEKTGILVADCLEAGLAGYVGLYGDKTKVTDPATGKPMVARHYDLSETPTGFELIAHGATGHMGAIRERDGAITKLAHLLRSLIRSRAKLESAGGRMRFAVRADDGQRLVLEGGQGFVPTHRIEEVMARMRRAAQRGAGNYLRSAGCGEAGEGAVKVTYEKLHNVAFDGDPNSASVRHALQAAELCGIRQEGPVLGWTVSCDARLFTTEYPAMQVLTFGPGQLAHAHSDQEQIEVEDIRKAAECLAVFLLQHTGTIEVRSPKSEVRKKAEIRNPKPKARKIGGQEN